jgi:hypothetical protein
LADLRRQIGGLGATQRVAEVLEHRLYGPPPALAKAA